MQPEHSFLEAKKLLLPSEFSRFVQARGPVYWWEQGGFFTVANFALASAVLRNPVFSADRRSFFISRMPNLNLDLIPDFLGIVQQMMVMSDDGAHTRRRAMAAAGLGAELLERFRPRIKTCINQLIVDSCARGDVDFCRDIAVPLPSLVLADLFALPRELRADFYQWSYEMTQFFGGASQYRNEDGVLVNRCAQNIRDQFAQLLQMRRKEPGKDYLSQMMSVQPEFALGDEEVLAQAVMMLVAGQVTTTDQLCHNMFTMLSTPGVRDDLLKNPQCLETAIEEFNRLDPAVTFLFRVAREEACVGDTVIPSGGVVFLSCHAVNRDPAIFADPDVCNIRRRRNPHMAYGHGAHHCLGAPLARMLMQEVFRIVLSRFPSARLNPGQPSQRKHASLAFSGFASLPLLLEPSG